MWLSNKKISTLRPKSEVKGWREKESNENYSHHTQKLGGKETKTKRENERKGLKVESF